MCMFKSFVATKNMLYAYVGIESHEEIIDIAGLGHLDKRHYVRLVRMELIPHEYTIDGFRNVDKWIFSIDQDRIPDWFVTEEWEKRCRAWMKKNIHEDIEVVHSQLEVVLGNVDIMYGTGAISLLFGNVNTMLHNSSIARIVGHGRVETMFSKSKIGIMQKESSIGAMFVCSSVTVMNDNTWIEEMYDNTHVFSQYDNSKILRDNRRSVR